MRTLTITLCLLATPALADVAGSGADFEGSTYPGTTPDSQVNEIGGFGTVSQFSAVFFETINGFHTCLMYGNIY